MAKLTPKEMKAEIKELKAVQKEARATVQSYFKSEVTAQEAKTAIGEFEKAFKKIAKLTEKLEAA